MGFTLTGLAAIFLGGNYLANQAAGFPLGQAGEFFSAGAIWIITIFLGIKVASTITTLFYNIIEKEQNVGATKRTDR